MLNVVKSRFSSGKKKILLLAVLFFIIQLVPGTRDCSLFINHCKAQWVQIPNGMDTNKTVLSFTTIGNNIFAGTYQNGVYLSTNNGTSWAQISLNNITVRSLATLGNNIFAGTYYQLYSGIGGVYLSTNNGTNWTQTTLNNQTVNSLATSGYNILAGTDYSGTSLYYGVCISSDTGTTWTQTALNNETVLSLAVTGNNIFAGTYSSGVFLSTNNGISWTQTTLNNKTVRSLTISGNNIFVGTDNSYPVGSSGVYLSTNAGQNWIQTSLNNKSIYSLAVSENNIFAGTETGVYLSTNNGSSWYIKNQGFTILPRVGSLLVTNNYIFAGTFGQSVWRRSLQEIIGIKNISTEIPPVFSLSQNYPNPFNPVTKIKFDLPKSNLTLSEAKGLFVQLRVYDMLGKKVATLVNEQLQPGTYEVTFDGSNLSSGVYFYQLRSGNYIETKKLMLVK